VRDVAKAADLAALGVRVRHCDFARPDSLARAFEGAAQLLMISSNARATGGDPLLQHRAAIDAAKAAGVGRIVYTSHMGASASSAFPPMHDHAATEALLGESGIPWTALRNGFYASTVSTLIGDAALSGVLSAPADGKVSWTAHDDLATAAVAVLADEGRFEGPTPPLVADVALDLEDVARLLSPPHGAAVERQLISDDELAATMRARGAPEGAIAILLGLFKAARAGEFAASNDTLAALIGRPTTRLTFT
jgi:NAD(P)H dehydrogenase (quinone)